jgi:proline iminopeptidase
MICSSVNLNRFIVRPSFRPDSNHAWRKIRGSRQVRQGLDLDRFVLLGHSWGGILGIDYALKYQRHLSGLVISHMTGGMESYLKRTTALKAELLSPADRALLDSLEAAGGYDNPAYTQLIMEKLYPQMLCRIQPSPEPLTRSFSKLNTKIYGLMQAKSEFQIDGQS